MTQTLLECSIFHTLDATKEAYRLAPGEGAVASNVDLASSPDSFSTALGRTTLASFNLLPGFTLVALVPFTAFYGFSPVSTRTVYVYSSVNGALVDVGWYDPTNNTRTSIPFANPFTQAVQFGASLWTNGGDKISFSPANPGKLIRDLWQIQVPYQYSFNISGTWLTVGGGNVVDTYTYAVTLRRANSWKVSGGGTPFTYAPDLDSLQESSPVFSTSVAVLAGKQPGITVPVALGLANLVTGVTIGGERYYGCLYRSRTGAPTYTFVDYLANFAIQNDHNGVPSIIDTVDDATILSNANLTIHHDVPPMLGQTFPGPVVGNSAPKSISQSNQQVSFLYLNPTRITKHKSRMFALTLYPQSPQGTTPPSATLALTPQLWYSDYGTSWSFNADSQVLLVGPEDTPGNANYTSQNTTAVPWGYNLLPDTPIDVVSVGSVLVAFRVQTTWILYGDSPSEFIIRRGFDIGCIAQGSITPAEGGVFWLAPQGVFFFDGAAPAYISEGIRGALEALPLATLQGAVGSYRDKTFYLSVGGVTYKYYLPDKIWFTLPYAPIAAISVPSLGNELLFAGPTDSQLSKISLYLMESNAATDAGHPITATWVSNATDSGAPGQIKEYRYLQLICPKQPGMVTVRVDVDAGYATASSTTWKWDTSQGNGAFVHGIKLDGYIAQITITAVTDPNATAPLVIRSVILHGDIRTGITDTSLADKSGALNQSLNG